MTIPGYDEWKLQGPDEDICEKCSGLRQHDCMNCGGDGEVSDGVDCPVCDGSGTVDCECSDEPDGDYEYERRRDAQADRG